MPEKFTVIQCLLAGIREECGGHGQVPPLYTEGDWVLVDVNGDDSRWDFADVIAVTTYSDSSVVSILRTWSKGRILKVASERIVSHASRSTVSGIKSYMDLLKKTN
jgi:hypothetical protein